MKLLLLVVLSLGCTVLHPQSPAPAVSYTSERRDGPGITENLVDPKRAKATEQSLEQLLQWKPEELAEVKKHRIAISSDHYGRTIATWVAAYLTAQGIPFVDYSKAFAEAAPQAPVEYAVAALPALIGLSRGTYDVLILMCGDGLGMRDVAQAWPGAKVHYAEILHKVRSSRKSEGRNVLALGERLMHGDRALTELFVKAFISTPYRGYDSYYQRQNDLLADWGQRARARGAAISEGDFKDIAEQYPALGAVLKALPLDHQSGVAAPVVP